GVLILPPVRHSITVGILPHRTLLLIELRLDRCRIQRCILHPNPRDGDLPDTGAADTACGCILSGDSKGQGIGGGSVVHVPGIDGRIGDLTIGQFAVHVNRAGGAIPGVSNVSPWVGYNSSVPADIRPSPKGVCSEARIRAMTEGKVRSIRSA